MAPDAGETATNAVQEEVKASPENYDKNSADDLVAAAKDKLSKDLSDQDKAAAETKINAAKSRFETLLTAVKKRIELKTAIDKIKADDKNFDFLHAEAVISKIKADKAALVGTFGENDSVLSSVDQKETEVNAAAKNFYESVGKLNLTGITEAPDKSKNDYNQVMTQISKMQEASYNGFPGADDKAKEGLKKDFDQKIKDAVAALDQHKDELGLSDDDKASLKRFKFGIENLDAAEKEKDPGHLAGAKQYMEMNLAEQEARRVWASLPFNPDETKSWRATDMSTSVDKGWGANKANYNEAVAAFNKGLELSANRQLGDSTKARDLFREAANKWRIVLENQQAKESEEVGNDADKVNATQKKTEIEAYLKDNAVDTFSANIQTAWTEGQKAFEENKFKIADSKFALVTAEIERLGNDSAAVEKALATAKSNFEAKYGKDQLSSLITKEAEGIRSQLERSRVSNDFRIKVSKDVMRIYKEGGPAIDAYNRVMAAFKPYQEKRGSSAYDITANIIYEDGKWRIERGNFVEAAQKFNECAQIYEAINAGKADGSKSNAVIEGEVKEGSKEKADSLKLEAEAARNTATANGLNIGNLLVAHFNQAEDGLSQGYYARAINQYQQAINMVKNAQAAADIYNKAGLKSAAPGTDAYDFTRIGNKYYNDGSFAEAKTFYQSAADSKKIKSEGPEIASNQ